MKYVGSRQDNQISLKQQDVVTIKKGTLVLYRGEWKPAGRTYKVRIHHFSAIWVTQAAKATPYPVSWPDLSDPLINPTIGILSPSICFPGSGGYWSDVNLNDIPEAMQKQTEPA
jgi:hypothetical protein